MRSLVLGSALAFLLAAPASAQLGNPGFMAPDTKHAAPGVPAKNQNNTTDALFLKLAGEGGMAEVALGRLADRKAGHDGVRRFGRMMVDDHGKANGRLGALAKSSGVELPKELMPEHQAAHDALEKLSGAQFDLAYIDAQIVDHQKTAQLLQYEIGSGQNAELQRFAAETLPVVLAHLRHAQDLSAELKGIRPPASAAASEPRRPAPAAAPAATSAPVPKKPSN